MSEIGIERRRRHQSRRAAIGIFHAITLQVKSHRKQVAYSGIVFDHQDDKAPIACSLGHIAFLLDLEWQAPRRRQALHD